VNGDLRLERRATAAPWPVWDLTGYVSPSLVHESADAYQLMGEMAAKLAWAVGSTLGIPYTRHSYLHECGKEVAAKVMATLDR